MARSDGAERAEGASPAAPRGQAIDNAEVAARLDEVADLLSAQHANPFRVRAYRHAAQTLRDLKRPLAELLDAEGLAALKALGGVGDSLARSIEQLVRTGRLGFLERLRGEASSEEVLRTVPGLGPELARRIHDTLGIETLYELEAAAHDGRLARVPGMGPRRLRGILESLAGRFHRAPVATHDRPPVAELLEIDREYREAAAAGRLPKIAPRRFNPAGEAWLPILHATRGERHYTALYSNTARAHELGATHDWVVIYRDDHGDRGQWTVVTARSGPHKGERVVRGREGEA